MIKKLKALKAPELRLLLAVCTVVLFFAMAQTTPTGTDGCNGTHEHGKIKITNRYSNDITISFSGPKAFSFFVESQMSETSDNTKTGTYTYKANEVQGKKAWAGSVNVEKDKTAPVIIK